MEKYMVSQTIKFSDDTETVMYYGRNGNAQEIEETAAEMVASHQPVEESSVAGTEIEMELSDVESSEDVEEVE